MGADIHCVLQQKKKDKWETISILDINRDYQLFGLLAGVRDYHITPIHNAKGLPIDIKLRDNYYLEIPQIVYNTCTYFSEDDKYPRYYMGEHSYSYLTLDEIFNHSGLTRKVRSYYEEKDIIVSDILPEEIKELVWKYRPLTNYRLVFGFDS